MKQPLLSSSLHRLGLAFVLVSLLAAMPVWAAEATTDEKTEMSFEEKVSYVIGHQFVGNLKRSGITVEVEPLVRAIKEAAEGKPCSFSASEQKSILSELNKKRSEEQNKRQAEQAASRKEQMKQMRDRERPQAIKNLGPENAWKISLEKPEVMTFDESTDYFWVLNTNKGTIKVKLMPEVGPMHVTSTIFLTEKKFYDGLGFHRVIPGFMAQGGRVTKTATLEWGPGYEYDGEFDPKVKHDRPYLLSMANAGPGTDGSQFFLTFKATPWLDGKHTIFGEITEGKDVMKKLEAAGSGDGTPKEELLIKTATIEKKPKG